ncbi:MAG: YggS family pyridoxal phosphate-dependent enzyme [Bacteroidaceae bacterium]|nr:YggS family pyridoxal phosphate-dependent enzyme [Bacteroidaceae bacterium]
MSPIQSHIKEIQTELPEHVRLVAVSKFHPNEALLEAYKAGQRIFGESKVQEMTQKYETLPKDIEWHFIGHLQTNKIKYMAPYVALIHGVDSYKLLEEINKQAAKVQRIIPCLLQIHIAQEETKFGFSWEECRQMLNEGNWRNLTHVQISGVMGMATNTEDETEIANEFDQLNRFFHELKQTYFNEVPTFKEISMGMSDDYPIAIEKGSTLVRIGSKIFGERQY